MTLDNPAAASSTCRKLRLALMASLAVNVLIIGVVAGSMLMHQHRKGPHKPNILLGFARTLPGERADMVRQNVADAQPNLETLRKAVRDARLGVREQLIVEPFDQAKLDAALDKIVQADTDEHKSRIAVFSKTVAQFTPEERRQLRDWLEKRRPR